MPMQQLYEPYPLGAWCDQSLLSMYQKPFKLQLLLHIVSTQTFRTQFFFKP